jgi:hypothetical protein
VAADGDREVRVRERIDPSRAAPEAQDAISSRG